MSSYRKLGKYILLERLGAGGSGEVYLGYTQMTQDMFQFFAVKILNAEQSANPRAIKMLRREASLANVLKHNSIVSLYECGIDEDEFYVAMDYVKGLPLSRLMHYHMTRKQILKAEYAVYIARAVAAGLEYARTCKNPETNQEMGIAHRDISPQNVMVNFEGEVKIIDFGLARSTNFGDKTQSDQIMGKLKYISPEHASGEKVDHRTDIFSLGVILWEMLAGQRFYHDMADAQIVSWLSQPEYNSLRIYNDHISPELDKIVKRAVAGDPEERYHTAGELHDELNKFLNKNYPDFSPSEFRRMYRAEFDKEVKDEEQKLAAFITDIELNEKKFQKKFDEVADMVDRMGVVSEPARKIPKKNSDEAVERFRQARLAKTEKRKRARSIWRNYELKQFTSVAWKLGVALLVLSLMWSRAANKHYGEFMSGVFSTVGNLVGIRSKGSREVASADGADPSKVEMKYPDAPFTVQIRTRPTGARIYQNGKLLRLRTPALIRVSDAKSAHIGLETQGKPVRNLKIKPFEEDIFVDFRD